MRVALVGAAGYVGGELLRILLQHPEVRDLVAVSRSQAGKAISEVHPGLGSAHRGPFFGARGARSCPGARRGLSRARAWPVVRGHGASLGVRPGDGDRPRRGFPDPGWPAARALLRRSSCRSSGAPIPLRTGRRTGAVRCGGQPALPRPDVSRPPPVWRCTRSREPGSPVRRPSSASPARAARGCIRNRPPTIRPGPTICSPTR